MFCPVCAAPSQGLCPSCSTLTEQIAPVTHVPMQFKGTDRANVRDRQWQFKHAREVLATDASRADLQAIHDRLPYSKRGKALRNQIQKRMNETTKDNLRLLLGG